MQVTTWSYLKGALFGLSAVSIWSGWSVFTRLAVTTKFDAWDITALRFGVAAIPLLPVAFSRGAAIDWLGWRGLLLLIAGGGAPYVMLAAGGLHFAPAHDQAALNPGFSPFFVALIAAVLLHEALAPVRKIGLALILLGAVTIVSEHAAGGLACEQSGKRCFYQLPFSGPASPS
jgi:drug/metabolite transporter (DMT)-like permease